MTFSLGQKLLTIGVVASSVILPVIASEDDSGFYGVIGVGVFTPQDITHSDKEHAVDSGFSGELGIGYRFDSNVRTEFTYGLSSVEVDDSSTLDANLHSFLASAYYDFNSENRWVPYFGAGIGIASLETDLASDSEDSAFTYQGKIGISYNATETVDIFGEAIYQGVDQANVGNADWDEFGMWGGRIGTRFKF